jgi:hypothetical protein
VCNSCFCNIVAARSIDSNFEVQKFKLLWLHSLLKAFFLRIINYNIYIKPLNTIKKSHLFVQEMVGRACSNYGLWCKSMLLKYCHELGVRDYRRGMDLYMDLLTTCIHSTRN